MKPRIREEAEMDSPRHAARLIPVSGIGSSVEAEQRASSALLAVLSIVRDLSIALLGPLGAPKAKRAEVEAFTEVTYGRTRPDGLVRVSYGGRTWEALVEVKTKADQLRADQVNEYWGIARDNGYDYVLTISNEIAPAPGVHPTEGLKVRANSRVRVAHLSWTAILTTAIRIREHTPVDDNEQAWILNELIRYLEHPASGALAFDDMGTHWVPIRDGARTSALTKRTDGVQEVVARWDQLVRFAALKLSSEIGEDVQLRLTGPHRDPKKRQGYLIDELATTGVLSAALQIPKTAGVLLVDADLRAAQLTASMVVHAPDDRGARARVSWLLSQLKDAPKDLCIEAYAKNQRTPYTANLTAAQEDRSVLLGSERLEPHRFRIVLRSAMGAGRKAGKRERSFIDSVLGLIDRFYEGVVQEISEWRPPTPKKKHISEPDRGEELREKDG